MKISANELSSALCDLHDVMQSLRRRRGLVCLGEVQEFMIGLEAEIDIDPSKLKACIGQVEALLKSLDKKTLLSSKDDEDSGFTIKDCLEDVLIFFERKAINFTAIRDNNYFQCRNDKCCLCCIKSPGKAI